MRALFIFFLIFMMGNIATAQNIEITITNIKNSKGSILISFYKNPDNFPYKPFLSKKVAKTKIENGLIKVAYHGFEPGEYAMTLLDDENEDNDMNYRFFIPQEGYGFSNYVHKGLLPPDFIDCNFLVDEGVTKVTIKIKYI